MTRLARALPALLLLPWTASALVDPPSAKDARNLNQPHTKFKFTPRRFNSRAEWEAWRDRLRQQIQTAAGITASAIRPPAPARLLSSQSWGSVAVDNLLIETAPGIYLAANLYRPAKADGRTPGILIAHGHWKHGRLENTSEYSGPALGYHLARLGFTALAYDMVGYNDTRQLPHNFGDSLRDRLWNFHPLGVQLWNSMRALDYLASLPQVDPERLGMTGASGGGTQTFLLASIDNRLQAIAPVNMISAHFQGGCDCENAPGLRFDTNNMEIASVFAPKPMLMVAATGDWTRDTPAVEFPAIQAIYRLYGRPAHVEFTQFDTGHNYNRDSRQAVYRFFARLFLGQKECALCTENGLPVENTASLRLFKENEGPEDALPANAIREQWASQARSAALTATLPALKDRLVRTMAVEWPRRVTGHRNGAGLILAREGSGERIPAVFSPASRSHAVLVVHPQGSAAAQNWWKQTAAAGAGESLLFIDAFQTGAAAQPQSGGGGAHHLTFNRTPDAHRVQDILTALAFLNQEGYTHIRLAAPERAAPWALFAAAVAPVRLTLTARLNGFDGSDEAFEKSFFVPGIQSAGGLPAALRLIRAGGRVQWGEIRSPVSGPSLQPVQ